MINREKEKINTGDVSYADENRTVIDTGAPGK